MMILFTIKHGLLAQISDMFYTLSVIMSSQQKNKFITLIFTSIAIRHLGI